MHKNADYFFSALPIFTGVLLLQPCIFTGTTNFIWEHLSAKIKEIISIMIQNRDNPS